jgi:hypothetical protein
MKYSESCSRWPMKTDRLDLKALWPITSTVSVTTAVGGYALGKAVDCKPGQIDGQCGLSTFIGLLLRCRDGFSALPDLDRMLPNHRLPSAERLQTKVKMSLQ